MSIFLLEVAASILLVFCLIIDAHAIKTKQMSTGIIEWLIHICTLVIILVLLGKRG